VAGKTGLGRVKIGLFSDVHGNHVALAAALNVLQEVDAYFFLGDLAGYYPFINQCLELWPNKPLWAVRGNHDQVLLDCLENHSPPSDDYQRRYGSALHRAQRELTPDGRRLILSWPREQTIELQGAVIGIMHGAPWDSLEGRVYPDFKDWDRFAEVAADIIVLGHTHYPLQKTYQGKLIVNPGSVGQPRDQSTGACCASLDLDSGEVQHWRVPYDKTSIIDDASKHDPNNPYLVNVLNR
jgi:putative phosphoesterase